MNKKILIITGPTATGKTVLALWLAKRFKGELVSADSRQVYKGMDIGTGKDLPFLARFHPEPGGVGGYYLYGSTKLWGYDLVTPDKNFSVSQYIKFAKKIIGDIAKRGNLPILVGGTGLYIKALLDGIPTAEIPQNKDLREKLKEKTSSELYETLAQLDPGKAGSLNSSDSKNPRRLIRAIEIATWKLSFGQTKKISPVLFGWDSLIVGLTTDIDVLSQKIKKRVDKRLARGLEKEIKSLLSKKIDWDSQAMSSLGYRQWRDYFEKKISFDQAIVNWVAEEKKYTKRQMTWFKKDARIKWFDIKEMNTAKKVENLVKKWYYLG